jgi:hypothetical protein
MERKHVDTSQLDAFIKAGSGLGYTTSSQRLDIADSILSRTKLRGKKAESATEAIEKLYFQDNTYWNKKGISSSADLAELLTKKTLSRYDKQLLSDMGIKGSSVGSRLRNTEKLTKSLSTEDVAASDPLAALQNRMSEFSKKMGKTMIEPMLKVLTVANKIIDVINSIPGAPSLVAMGMVLVSASGAASLLMTALAPLIGIYAKLTGTQAVNAVTTTANTATTGTNVAVTNMSTSARLRLAAATIYHSAATKAAALSQWLLNAAMTANPLGIVIVALVALAGVLYYVEKRTHLFSNAWKSLAKSDFVSGLIGGVDKLYSRLKSTGLLRLVAGAALGPIGLMGATATSDDVREKIWAGMMGLLNWVRTSFPFLSKIHDVMKKVYSIFEWIYSLWQGFWSWIKNAIPGAAKENKREEVVRLAQKRGIHLNSAGELWLDKLKGGRRTPTADEIGPKLQKAYNEWKALPGFAEGIAEAVARGLGGIGTTIADAIVGAFPDFSSLTKILETLNNTIVNWNPLNWGKNGGPFSGTSGSGYSDYSFAQPGKVDQTYRYYPDKDKVVSLNFGVTGVREGDEVSWDDLPKSAQDYFNTQKRSPGHAKGVSFKRSGWFGGNVHAPEELIPQAIASKGPGPISRALDAFYGATSNQRVASASEASRSVEVHVHSSYDFSGLRVSSAVDIDKLMREIDRRIANGSVEAVKRAIGQRRT